MLSLVAIVARILQSVEFFRTGFGRWFVLFFEKLSHFKFFILPFFILGMIRLLISLFASMCHTVQDKINEISAAAVSSGGVDFLALANTVLPIDELVGLIVAWAAVYATCASIRFVRAAWSAVPLKAS